MKENESEQQSEKAYVAYATRRDRHDSTQSLKKDDKHNMLHIICLRLEIFVYTTQWNGKAQINPCCSA